MSNPIQRLRHDIQRLHKAQRELKHDRHDLHKDTRELKHDQKALKKDQHELKHAHNALDRNKKEIKHERKTLENQRAQLSQHTTNKTDKIAALEERRALLEQMYQDSFDPMDPTSQGDPSILAERDAVVQKEADVTAEFDAKIAEDQKSIDKSQGILARRTDRATEQRADIQAERKEIQKDRKELKHDRKVLQHDRKELKHDHNRVHDARHRALKHLRPAEYKMGLKRTNHFRQELGLKKVDHVIRPMNLNTVRGCAQFLLKSPNVSFWSGLSSGSDRANLERLARGQPAFVPATGGHVFPKLSMMRALVDMAKHGRIMINALTGGTHSVGSNHYRGTAVDLDLSTGNSGMIESIARKYGGARNFETDHIHLDF